jgi:hypothetical protein
MTSTLEGCEWSAARHGRTLPPGKTRYPLCRRLGGPQGRSGQARKISPPPGFDPRAVHPVVSPYTDWSTRPTIERYIIINIQKAFVWNTCCSCQILMKVDFSQQIFKNTTKFDENPTDASRVAPCGRINGQTYEHDEGSSRLSKICEHALRLRQLRHFDSYLILTKNKMDFSHILRHIVCLDIINPSANKNKCNLYFQLGFKHSK